MTRQSPEQLRREAVSRGGTLLITNLTKLAGIAVGVNELVFRANTTTARIALAALMMTGAQVSEGVLLKIIDRIFSRP